MTVASHRLRFLFFALLLAWLVLLLMPRPAHGGWSADPVQVHATSALCPAVSVSDDGHYGAIVVWQENTVSGGLLKAQHLLANGDLDPAWSSPTAVSDLDAARSALGAVRDGAGGAYVWWMQSTQLYITHVSATGGVSAGWPAHGRSLGWLPTSAHRPSAVSDGTGGIYLGWLSTPPFNQPVSILVVHLGPSNTGAGGWPLGPRSFGLPADPGFTVSAFGLDAVPGGGLWLGWQTVVPVNGADTPGELRALRLTSTGLPAGGWSGEGVLLAPYDPAFDCATGWSSPVRASQVAVSSDGGSGAFVVASRGSCEGGSFTVFNSLRHLGALGEPAPGWSPDGVALGNNYSGDIPDPGADASLRALSDQRGGVFAGLPVFGSEFLAMMTFSRRSSAGTSLAGDVWADQRGIEFAPRGDGGMFIASFKPSGATGPYEADAHVAVSQSSPGAGFYESKTSYSATRYGDIGLAAAGDGGAIFAWSQLIDRQGVYAIRLGQGGMVTGVPPTPVVGAPTLRVRFVRGEGVHAVATIAGSPRVTLSLHDLAGRRVSSGTSDATLGADVLLPGTRDLPGGVYFARAIGGGARELHARVIVLP